MLHEKVESCLREGVLPASLCLSPRPDPALFVVLWRLFYPIHPRNVLWKVELKVGGSREKGEKWLREKQKGELLYAVLNSRLKTFGFPSSRAEAAGKHRFS